MGLIVDDKPIIFDYSNYRDFLKDFSERKREVSRRWTYGVWARRLGLKSTSLITMILKGRRHLSSDLTEKFVRFFSFTEAEAAYFRELVRVQKLTDSDTRLTVLMMDEIRRRQENGERPVLSRWQTYVLRELTETCDFVPDRDWVKAKMKNCLASETVDQILDKLVEAGVLTPDLRPRTKLITDRSPSTAATKLFHQDLMEVTKGAVNLPKDVRALVSSTLVVRRDQIAAAKEAVRQFQVQFSEQFECPADGQEVYILNVQFFPPLPQPEEPVTDEEAERA